MLNSEVFFSVIIPIYNAEVYLRRCIESILSQSFDNYELILVNDCSSDASLNICNDYAQRLDNVIVIDLENNAGVVNAREVGLINSSGKYIIYVDADDAYLSDDRLSNIYEEIMKNGSDIVATGYSVGPSFEKTRKILNSLKSGFYSEEEYKSLRERIFSFNKTGTNRLLFPSLWSKVVRRELYLVSLGKVDHELKIGEDAAISYVALALARSLSVLEDTSYFYYQHNSQASRGYHKGYFPACVENYQHMEEILEENNPEGDYGNAIKENILHVSAYSVLNEGRNPDRDAVRDILEEITNNEIVKKAIVEYGRVNNIFFQYVVTLIRKKAFKRMSIIGKLYCLFMH